MCTAAVDDDDYDYDDDDDKASVSLGDVKSIAGCSLYDFTRIDVHGNKICNLNTIFRGLYSKIHAQLL